MAVDASHPGCFVHATKLYAVPSDSAHSVAETHASYVAAALVLRRAHRPFTLRTVAGGLIGGTFLALGALLFSHVFDVVALTLLFVFGAAVGLLAAIGIGYQQRQLVPQAQVVRLPAIQIPSEVARNAPDDATADELVLWSILTRRFRAARVALENLPFELAGSHGTAGPGAGPRLPATVSESSAASDHSALAEITYVTARHDFEPVALLLGLPLPD